MGQLSKTTLAPENALSNKKREVQKIIFEDVPSKPVKSEPKSDMARSLPRPERLQRPVLTSFPSTKPPILPSLGLQPISHEQQQQGSAQEQPSAPPATEQEPAGQTFAGSNVYSQQPQAGNQGSNTQSHSGAKGYHQGSNQSRRSTQSFNYSCTSPHIKQLFQAFTSRLLHFSSAATRASITFFCILSSLPGFLIHSALYLVLATSLLGLPLPALLAGHVIYSVVTFLHPICALVLLLPCLHRRYARR